MVISILLLRSLFYSSDNKNLRDAPFRPPGGATLRGVTDTAVHEQSRSPVHWVTPAVIVAAMVLGPPLADPLIGGWGILAGLCAVAFFGALIDARLYRDNLTVIAVTGGAYFLAMAMYFNPGTWIYLPLMVVLALAGTIVGAPAGAEGTEGAEGAAWAGGTGGTGGEA